jgi:ribose 5-phosphate isomerase B
MPYFCLVLINAKKSFFNIHTLQKMNISIGCDHAGFPYKNLIINFLTQTGHQVIDKGTMSLDSVDYPDFAHAVAQTIQKKEADLGILLCGSGNGVAITANKYTDVRAALAWNTQIAQLGRQHNHANVLCLPVRFISESEALQIVEIFLHTAPEIGRHAQRVAKISIQP